MTTDWSTAREIAWRAGAGASLSRATPIETVGLADTVGRTLAVAVHAPTDLPAFDSSAMDGWVVAGSPPWLLGEPIAAGDEPVLDALAAGRARPISTGGWVPAGALGILRLEDGEVDGDHLTVRVGVARGVVAGLHVRRAGEEARAGDLLLAAGSVLTPPRVAIAAIAGADSSPSRAHPMPICFCSAMRSWRRARPPSDE